MRLFNRIAKDCNSGEKPKKKRKIVDIDVEFISLCEMGANNIQTALKSLDKDNKVEIKAVAKLASDDASNPDPDTLWSLAYVPDAVDLHGDYASKDIVKRMCHTFAKNKGSIDIKHSFKALNTTEAYVAESFITTPADRHRHVFKDLRTYDGKEINFDGAWAVAIKLESQALRDLYKSSHGKWNGISIGGTARMEDVEDEDNCLLREFNTLKEFIKNTLATLTKSEDTKKDFESKSQQSQSKENEMNEEQIKALVAKLMADSKQAESKSKQGVAFEGDPLNPEDLKKHKIKVLQANADLNSLEGIALFEKEVNKLNGVEAVKSNSPVGDIKTPSGKLTPEQMRKALEEADAKAFHAYQDRYAKMVGAVK